jgi:glutamyl-tRNA reductase
MTEECFVFGVNHHMACTEVLGQFSLSQAKQNLFFEKVKNLEIKSLAILNTCNRVEIIGLGKVNDALNLFLEITGINETQQRKVFIKEGQLAVEHLFKVAAGLDSKVIGDLEILGQVKDAFYKAKNSGLLKGYLERMSNTCFQAAKEIRHCTHISDGTTSLAYAIIKLLKDKDIPKNPKILLIGAGSFAKTIMHNLTTYMHHAQLFITNRTDSRAIKLSDHFQNVKSIPFSDWRSRLGEFDIVISAVSSPEHFLINEVDVPQLKHTYLLDLSVPYSIDPRLRQYLGNRLINIEMLSQLINHTIKERKSDIPVAKQILDRHLQGLYKWSDFYKNTNSLRSWKQSLYERVEHCTFLRNVPSVTIEKYVNKSMSHFALHLKNNKVPPTDTQNVLNEFLAIYHEAEIAGLMQQKPTPYADY